ncbi:MAG TPA: endonuclease/exonuclease/phosphatase family protein [Stenomitos sp.]
MRLVTINLSGVSDGWFEGRREALVSGLRALELDLVCLQEVASRGSPYPYDQVEDLTERLELPFACFSPYGNPEEIESRERGGVAIVSRWPFRMVETLPLPPGKVGPDARVASLVSFTHPHGEFHVLATHLSWPLDASAVRSEQLRYAMARVCDLGWDQPGARFILAGDLNAVESEPGIAHLTEHLQDAYRGRHPDLPGLTWTHENPLVWYDAPDRRVDYLFVDRAAEVVAADVVLCDPECPASDHYGVFGHFRWNLA